METYKAMISLTDVFIFRARLNKLVNELDKQNLTEDQKTIVFDYLNQVIELAEETLR